MKLSGVYLAEAASEREGLLNVLGMGISNLWRPSWPGPMGVTAVVLGSFESTDKPGDFPLRLVISGPIAAGGDGAEGIVFEATVHWPGFDDPETPAYVLPIVNLTNAALPSAGVYSITATFGDQKIRSTFRANDGSVPSST